MFRKSVLITLISTAALGVALDAASARGVTLAGARAANTPTVTRVSLPPRIDPGFWGHGRRFWYSPTKTSTLLPNKITPAYVHPNAAVQIKPNYGSTLKPLPLPPIAAATNHPGTGVVATSPTPAPSATPMHWPHKPGFYGMPAMGTGAIIASAPIVGDAPAVGVASAPVVAAATPSSAHPLAANPDPCTCLSKQYTPRGAVVFMDRCTNEVAVTTPRQTGDVTSSQLPQQLRAPN